MGNGTQGIDGKPPAHRAARQGVLPGLDSPTGQPDRDPLTPGEWLARIVPALADLSPDALPLAEAALRAMPTEPALLVAAALAALLARQPDRAMAALKRFERRYEADEEPRC